MAILTKFRELIKRDKDSGVKVKARHIAVTTEGAFKWARDNKKSFEEAHKQTNQIIINSIKEQIKISLPVLTIYLLPSNMTDVEHFTIKVDSIIDLLNQLIGSELVTKNQIKISVFGKWYDLPGRIVDPIKRLLESTKDYDSFFVNFCINYNGQDEIVDACKILSMQVKTEKIGLDSINKDNIKDNLYTSDFLPPDLIVKNGIKQRFGGLLLWDSINASIYFTKKNFPDFDNSDFKDAINAFEKQKI